jgi:hypothetical protein
MEGGGVWVSLHFNQDPPCLHSVMSAISLAYVKSVFSELQKEPRADELKSKIKLELG